MRRQSVFLLSLLLMVLIGIFAACAQLRTESAPVAMMAMATQPAQMDLLAVTQASSGLVDVRQEDQQPVTGRIILRSATLRLIVTDPDDSLAQMTALTNEFGGWVVNSNTNRVALASGGETTRATIRLRVPAERLDEALTRFKEGVVKVDSETITGEDVTQDYVDVSSRLTNLEAAEAQLRQIMEDATETEDVLNVYNELVRVRGEIETLRGRLNYYDEAAAYSLVTVELVPEAIQQPIQIAGWSPGRTAENAIASLLYILRGLADFLIGFVIVGLPLLLIAVVVAWLILRLFRRLRRQPIQGN